MADIITLAALIDLIKEVQPSVEDLTITGDESVVDDLGIDSLDLLQLSRRISRDYEVDLDMDAWGEQAEAHGRSVKSILDFLSATAGV
jgi:acyl carrier protein